MVLAKSHHIAVVIIAQKHCQFTFNSDIVFEKDTTLAVMKRAISRQEMKKFGLDMVFTLVLTLYLDMYISFGNLYYRNGNFL